MAHFFAAAALFRSRSSGANRRLTSSGENASGSKSSPSRARLKTYGLCVLRDPFYRHSAGSVSSVAAVDPFGRERPSNYAAAGVLSRSSGILFKVKPDGDWLAVRYRDTEKQDGALGVPQMESASRVEFRDRSKPFMLDRNACHELKMRVNGTDFKSWLDGNLAPEHTLGTEPPAIKGTANPEDRQHESRCGCLLPKDSGCDR